MGLHSPLWAYIPHFGLMFPILGLCSPLWAYIPHYGVMFPIMGLIIIP